MAKYIFEGPVPMIFGDLRHGVNCEVQNATAAEGSTVVLRPRDVITTTDEIEHAFLIPFVPAEAPAVVSIDDKKNVKSKPAPKTTPAVEEPVEAETPAPVTKD